LLPASWTRGRIRREGGGGRPPTAAETRGATAQGEAPQCGDGHEEGEEDEEYEE